MHLESHTNILLIWSFRTLREKEDLEQMIMDGVSKLKISITALHKRVVGERLSEKTKTSMTLLSVVGDEKRSIDDLIKKVAQIEIEAQLLEEKNNNLGQWVNTNKHRKLDYEGIWNVYGSSRKIFFLGFIAYVEFGPHFKCFGFEGFDISTFKFTKIKYFSFKIPK